MQDGFGDSNSTSKSKDTNQESRGQAQGSLISSPSDSIDPSPSSTLDCGLPTLPQDVLLLVSKRLDPKDLNRLSSTCSDLYLFIQLAWEQWLVTRSRIRILPAHRQLRKQAGSKMKQVGSKPQSNAKEMNEDSSGDRSEKVERSDHGAQRNQEMGIGKIESASNRRVLSLHPSYSAYLVAHTYLVDKAWQLPPSLKATILPLPSSNPDSAPTSYRLYSRDSLSLPILKLCSKGLLLITRDQIRLWDSESLRKKGDHKDGSIGESRPQLFILKEMMKNGKQIKKSSAWDDVSCCQVFESKSREIKLIVGRVNGSLESWTLFPSDSSSLQSDSSSTKASKVKLNFFSRPPRKPRLAGAASSASMNGSSRSSEDPQDGKETKAEMEPLDGSEIQAVSLDRQGLVAFATKKGRISIWKLSTVKSPRAALSNVKSSTSSPPVPPSSTLNGKLIPGAPARNGSFQSLTQATLSKSAKKRAKARAAKLQVSQEEDQDLSSKPELLVLSTWSVPKPSEGTNGVVRTWSILLGGDDHGNKWVSIGMTGINPILIYPIDSVTFKPLDPFHLSASGRPTSVYALASTSMYISAEEQNPVIPSHLLFAGCYDGSVRVYDLREVTRGLERRSQTHLDNLVSNRKSSEESHQVASSSIDISSLSLNQPEHPIQDEDKPVQAIKTFKDRFDDSAVYDLALGGGEGKMIMAGTARNGVVRFFKWEGEEIKSETLETKLDPQVKGDEGFSLFAAHPSTSSSPTYSLVADYDRVFGATQSKLWEMDFRPKVRLPGESFESIDEKNEWKGFRGDVLNESRAYYRHGDMHLEHTQKRIGEK